MNSPSIPDVSFPNTLTPFRFFCQRVLPSVYGNSLSYYELLCKVTEYLNETMSNVNDLNDDMKSLYEWMQQLQNWIDEYFDNLDVQQEINQKLDEMAENGQLQTIMERLFSQLSAQIANIDAENRTLSAQIANIIAHNDDTEGNSELIDIRVGYDGRTYSTAGAAVRSQASETGDLQETIWNNSGYNILNPAEYIHNSALLSTDGTVTSSSSKFVTGFRAVKKDDIVYARGLKENGNYSTMNIARLCVYDSNKGFIGCVNDQNTYTITDENAAYIRLCFANSILQWQLPCVSINYALNQNNLFEFSLKDKRARLLIDSISSPNGLNVFAETDVNAPTDTDTISKAGIYWTNFNTSNVPEHRPGMLLHFVSLNSPTFRKYQMWFSYDSSNVWYRNSRNNQWSDWVKVLTSNDYAGVVTDIVWFGDSISALRTLPDDVAATFNVTVHDCSCPGSPLVEHNNYGQPYVALGFKGLTSAMESGSYAVQDAAIETLEERGGTWDFEPNLNNFKNIDWSNVSTAVIFYGTNDFGAAVISMDDFKTGMKSEIVKLMNAHPSVRIYVITPMWRGELSSGGNVNALGYYLTDYVQAEIEVCNELNIPVLDLYHTSGINEYTASTFLLSDMLHQNKAGNPLLTKKISNFIRSN